MLANPQDHVVDMRVTAANAFLQFGDPSRKSLYTLAETEHSHSITSEMLSPSAVDEVSQVVNGFVKHAKSPKATSHKKRHHRPLLFQRSSMSVPARLGLYGRRFPSLQDLTRPLEA
jgi:hypothetical protein